MLENKMVPLTYGCNESGLICCYHFINGRAEALDQQQLMQWLALPSNERYGFVWVHVNLTHASAETWLKQSTELPEDFYESLHEGVRSTRIERVDETLIAVINDVVFDFDFETSDIATLWMALTPELAITARTKPLRSVDRLRMAVREGEDISSTVHILIHLLHDQAEVLTKIVRTIADKTDTIEDHLLDNKLEPNRINLGTMRRLLVRLERLLAPEPSALFRLLHRPPQWVKRDDLQDLSQSTEEFATVIQDIHALQERNKLLQEEIAAQVNEQNNRSLYVLTIVSVLALPINIIAGLLGMNVGGIPLASDANGFWVVVAIIVTFTLIAGYFAFRRNSTLNS